ncbi:hypothetical protein DSO57_1008161 [Entomophthora muscae]|uniref:Uncharacterized protein n=1 Tax=Entomophthora muscae TaxID=34485 RepID=A0ACC2T722_9FUNG|nr:hypothetical protein DSO57_1008161 [Entomophthora muscae]
MRIAIILQAHIETGYEGCGIPAHQLPKCVLGHSQGLDGRGYHFLRLKWAFIHSQKEEPLRNLLVYGLGGHGNNVDLKILGALQQYLGLLILDLRLLHLILELLHLILGLLLLKLGLLRCTWDPASYLKLYLFLS